MLFKCVRTKINFRDLDIATSITGKEIETIDDRCNEIFNGVYNAAAWLRVPKTRISVLPIERIIYLFPQSPFSECKLLVIFLLQPT